MQHKAGEGNVKVELIKKLITTGAKADIKDKRIEQLYIMQKIQ